MGRFDTRSNNSATINKAKKRANSMKSHEQEDVADPNARQKWIHTASTENSRGLLDQGRHEKPASQNVFQKYNTERTRRMAPFSTIKNASFSTIGLMDVSVTRVPRLRRRCYHVGAETQAQNWCQFLDKGNLNVLTPSERGGVNLALHSCGRCPRSII